MKWARNGTTVAIPLLIAANVAIPLAIVTFALGFFPYKPLLPGLAQYDNSEYGPPPPAPFDRLVFMVVDALRSDFVYAPNSGFQYTQSLIRDGAALPFTAHATSPTVTMPRIKAITTGSIPSFLDVILNVDEGDKSSSLASQDTWLAQMKAKKTGKQILYGDDTWLKLFPETFDRADGTSSFFVADFTEVDTNVTRHVPGELSKDDWNTMVLHYLGLDHIGHKGGPRSPNMLPKQREMDGMVKHIYEALVSQSHLHSTLLVVCGDHGMNDAGNHGASSAGETSPALVFVSPKIKALSTAASQLPSPVEEREDFQYYSTVEQSDLAPTLGALLGFPVPKNNLGAFILEFLPFWPADGDKLQLLMRNAQQILGIVNATFGADLFALNSQAAACQEPQTDIEELACEWKHIELSARAHQRGGELDPAWILGTSQWLRKAQRIMSSMASNYDMPKLFLGLAAAVGGVILASVAAAALSGGGGFASFVPFTLITVAYGIMMFASSYVEEEHHFWYWSSAAWLLSIGSGERRQKARSASGRPWSLALVLVAARLIRGWNQTGQKFAGEPDLVKVVLHANPVLLWVLVGATYLCIFRDLLGAFDALPTVVDVAGTAGLVLAAFFFKLAFTREDSPELVTGFARTLAHATLGSSLVVRARAVFIGLAIGTACVFYFVSTRRKTSSKASAVETLLRLYTVLAVTQSRATNIPLFLLFDVLFRHVRAAQHLSMAQLSTAALLLQFSSFFALGGSNAISSVDLSSAYNGISGFDAPAVGLLIFVGNWAAPLYWTFAVNVLLLEKRRAGGAQGANVFLRHVATLTVFTAASAASVMAACTVLRTHLFIWTVFSPKYLYCIAWSLGMHLGANVVLGGILYWLGTL